jgi:hypothetical protein
MKILSDDTISHDAVVLNSGCAQCQTEAHLTLISRPDFNSLKVCRPAITGLAFLCLKCQSPTLVTYTIKHIGEHEILLGEVVRHEDKTDGHVILNYLPSTIKKMYEDAIGCYEHDLLEPFALMCRQTIEAIIKDLGDTGKMRVFNHIEELRDILKIEPCMFDSIDQIIFGPEKPTQRDTIFGKTESAVLLEIMKDLLYQIYVRKARLQRVFNIRQFFAEQKTPFDGNKITHIHK